MLTRLFYHWFWNTYDNLGPLTLAALIHVVLITIAAVPAYIIGSGGTVVIYAGLVIAITALAMTALLQFSARAARGENVRAGDLLVGLKCCWGRALILTLLFAGITVISYINLRIYFSIDLTEQARAVQLFVMVMAGLQGWILLLVLFLAWPVLCASTADVGPFRLREAIRRGLITVTLQPGLWIVFFLAAVLFLVLCAWSTIGLIVYLPLTIMLAQTGYFLSMQYTEFLGQARDELGEDASLSALKRQARQLAIEWESSQHPRTIRELIKPWEY